MWTGGSCLCLFSIRKQVGGCSTNSVEKLVRAYDLCTLQYRTNTGWLACLLLLPPAVLCVVVINDKVDDFEDKGKGFFYIDLKGQVRQEIEARISPMADGRKLLFIIT